MNKNVSFLPSFSFLYNVIFFLNKRPGFFKLSLFFSFFFFYNLLSLLLLFAPPNSQFNTLLFCHKMKKIKNMVLSLFLFKFSIQMINVYPSIFLRKSLPTGKHLSFIRNPLGGFPLSLCRTKSRAIVDRYRYYRQKKRVPKHSLLSIC